MPLRNSFAFSGCAAFSRVFPAGCRMDLLEPLHNASKVFVM